MSKGFDWEKVNRDERRHYYPKPAAQAATSKQLKFIEALLAQKDRKLRELPRTKKGASNVIERLLGLPDAGGPTIYDAIETEVRVNPVQEITIELREHFPQLSPMTAASLVQLFYAIDPIGIAFTVDALFREDSPNGADELVLHLLRRFIQEFSDISEDDTALVEGRRHDGRDGSLPRDYATAA